MVSTMSMVPAVYVLLCLTSAVLPVSTNDRFLVSAPNVFHVGVKERVSVQLFSPLLNQDVSLYLEDETTGQLVSQKVTIRSTQEGEIKIAELEVNSNKLSELASFKRETPYVLLVCEIRPGQRKMTRVLISQHRGYIFIQTNQPVYNPTQRVHFRIFTLDYSMRPHSDALYVTIINAGGNKVKTMTKNAKDGILSENIQIPDVSEPGIWKIVAHYQGDEKNAVTREFQVKKFVLPSFGVSIKPQQSYYPVNLGTFTFTIDASYSYGETVDGAFHCRFGVKEAEAGGEKTEIVFIRGMEKTGSVKDGKAEVTVHRNQILDILKKSKTDLNDMTQLADNGVQFYIAVSVTDINSGELQEAEVLLPIVSRPYSVDLSRTRTHFIPKVPFQVQAVVRLPNGSPAPGMEVKIQMPVSGVETKTAKTDAEGLVNSVFFSIPDNAPHASFTVTVDGHQYHMTALPATSPSKSFLFLSMDSKIVTPGQTITVDITTVQGNPVDGQIYYLVLSRGMLKKSGQVKAGEVTRLSLPTTSDLTPSFRLIGYYYNQGGDIIADSLWVDVSDLCEGKISLKPGKEQYRPRSKAELDIDLHGQKAKVGLLAVDKAIYALNVHNKLTAKQVFSSMQSYDLGCSYFGGVDTAAVLNNAGLSFISHSETVLSQMRDGFRCKSGFRRQKRSLDLQQLMMTKVTSYTDERLRKCCQDGFTLIPMRISCEQRAQRVSRGGKGQACVTAFLDCCLEGVKQRNIKMQEEALKGRGRTSSAAEMEDFFDTNAVNIRRFFEPSFEFKEINVDGKTRHSMILPDSITTWEIQAVSLSSSHGFCVSEPKELRAWKDVFVSLRLPYSVKRYEQLVITAVIYNYGASPKELSVHMKPVEGLCSPGSASSLSHLNVTVSNGSSQAVTFSAVPMATGHIPVTLLLYDKKEEMGLDAIQKLLLVATEGVEKREERTHILDMDGRSAKTFPIDGDFPNSTVPESGVNLFVKIEGEVFGKSTVLPLLSASGVKHLLRAPMGCAEQTMIRMSPTALALRYLDYSQSWKDLPPGTRDTALTHIEDGYTRILTYKKDDGSYGAWLHRESSTWLTALVVKVMSLVLERQWDGRGERGRVGQGFVREEIISESVTYLISKQDKLNGGYTDPHPVIHREMQGGIGGLEGDVSLTAFITIALHNSLPYLSGEVKEKAEASISASVAYLNSAFPSLKRPYAAAITAYCLSICQKDSNLGLSAWNRLKELSTIDEQGECQMWPSRSDMRLANNARDYLVPSSQAITVETTSYALLTALANKDMETADSVVCWLSRQENYGGGFSSTQDTIVALEALTEYALKSQPPASTNIDVQFSVPGRSVQEKLSVNRQGEKVEAELKRLIGNQINVQATGKGKAKMKVVMAYHALQPEDVCQLLSITVSVQGKVKYTAQILEDYDYTDYGADGSRKEEEDRDVPRTEIEWFDARSRRRRDTSQSQKAQEAVEYAVCVSHDPSMNLSGMAIADITLLSGFEAVTEDLEKLKDLSDQYISHYETKEGRVLLYFDEVPDGRDCVTFGAIQRVPIGLLQPAPASFYDYYEPDRKCTVFYAAPQRSRMVSTLCSGDVCQCAEKPCHKEQKTFQRRIKKKERLDFACYYPTVDFGYTVKVDSVSEKSNFELYHTTVLDVLRATNDAQVAKGSVRIFAKRRQCKGALEMGKSYLIMGKDGTTTDTHGQMQYLLDSASWVEQLPTDGKCKGTNNRLPCRELNNFLSTYQIDGCTQ
ncbi:complement C4-B [Megalops cyprinoides]|uniref:complement C4-B n=1 Tax=Megalops cyprinoides TaxID=118141 RepID=UPI0018649E88|nr:complement C4-B [Megalops cyprinoides]